MWQAIRLKVRFWKWITPKEQLCILGTELSEKSDFSMDSPEEATMMTQNRAFNKSYFCISVGASSRHPLAQPWLDGGPNLPLFLCAGCRLGACISFGPSTDTQWDVVGPRWPKLFPFGFHLVRLESPIVFASVLLVYNGSLLWPNVSFGILWDTHSGPICVRWSKLLPIESQWMLKEFRLADGGNYTIWLPWGANV